MLKYVVASVLLAAAPAFAGETVQQPMSFSDCLQSVQQAQANLPTPGTVTIDTPEKKETVLTVPDGQVTVTCDANAGQATMTHN